MIALAHSTNTYCVGALGTITAALQASRALSRRGIFCEVIGLSANETKRGCAYGISFDCAASDLVRAALREEGISVSQYLQRGRQA